MMVPTRHVQLDSKDNPESSSVSSPTTQKSDLSSMGNWELVYVVYIILFNIFYIETTFIITVLKILELTSYFDFGIHFLIMEYMFV